MCEHCREGRTWQEPFVQADEMDFCEYSSEDASEHCERPPSMVTYDRHVEDHLCAEHVALADRQLDEGRGQLLREAGLQQSEDFLPLQEEATCSFIESGPQSLPACGEPATHAKMVIDVSTHCSSHAYG